MMKSIHIGTVQIGSQNLNNVLYIPELYSDLISVRALTKEGKKVLFNEDGTVETIGDNNICQIGYTVNNSYQLDVSSMVATSSRNTTLNNEYILWHHQFGHAGQKTILKLSDFVIGLDNIKFAASESICRGCIHTKSHQQPFSMATNHSKELLKRI